MIGHKTSGDWGNLTSFGRNEIVFEGRNKEYGAYVLRQRYNNSLMLALLIASSVGILCAGVPFLVRLLSPTKAVEKVPFVDYRKILKTFEFEKKLLPKTIPPPKLHNTPPSSSMVFPPRITKDDSLSRISDIPIVKDGSGATGKPSIPDSGAGLGMSSGGVSEAGIGPEEVKEPLTVVSEMPKFKDLEQYIKDHIEYPDGAIPSMDGTVYVSFIVEEDGSLSDFKVLRGISGEPGYTDAAINVLKGMPNWEPGRQNGHNVRVRLNLPIRFSFK